ncbi:MAG: tetratricopeptide repeat protein [Candidatus Aminicenantes bacterium]|nr:tetratricopeptide repeat protein [Candidatus Aminicenantes bacterium]NIM80874.1 tetratricopeptide repeat protein [Candidatus Aminicenantes bacterium]NIN20258.1 tetratricopeptide repeat protein [Candidatus Aminicenantes bacterium]NIN44037.1 tetratricopeptide repeat protein [Candidatus Aminicenantes bacterium]NIN86847.1 tetratricopeptide repeat protein [Candidatus Aminicenantes bacterium]
MPSLLICGLTDSKYGGAYYNMGIAYYRLKKYNKAIAAYKKAIEIDPEDNFSKMNLAEANFMAEHFNHAFVLANDLLKEKNISTQHILAMRFISIGSLVFQGKSAKAVDELKDFIKFYRSIPGEYERGWTYTSTKEFITGNKKLAPEQRKLLLQLVDLLESPKEKGDKKLKQLETAIRDIFK